MKKNPPALEDGTDKRVPKRRFLELRRRGITQKKTYYNMGDVFCAVGSIFLHNI